MQHATNTKRPSTDQSQPSGPTAKRVRRQQTLTRTDRAKIRILHSRGISILKIALLIGCSETLAKRTISSVEDDSGADYDFVDEAFKAKYPPPRPSSKNLGEIRFKTKGGGESGARRTGIRRNLTRADRAMIRILHERGFNKTDIAPEVGCTPTTVTNILNESTLAAANDDPLDDYEYVTVAFKAKYPPPLRLKKPGENRILEKKEEEEKENLPSITVRQSRAGIRASNRHSLRHISNISQQPSTHLSNLNTHIKKVHNPPNHSAPGPSRHRDNVDSPSPSPEIIEDLETPVANFLSKLDLDISMLHDALKAQGLGTSDKLFAISIWPEDKLHQMFKEALPEATAPHRFMLVMGLQAYARRQGL